MVLALFGHSVGMVLAWFGHGCCRFVLAIGMVLVCFRCILFACFCDDLHMFMVWLWCFVGMMLAWFLHGVRMVLDCVWHKFCDDVRNVLQGCGMP